MSWWFEKTADSVDAAVQAVMTDKNIPIPVALFTCEVIKGCGKNPTLPATLYVKSAGHLGYPDSENIHTTCTATIEARWIARSVLPETPAQETATTAAA